MYSTKHSRIRFLERVKNVKLPKRNKRAFIEQYIKRAFKEGLTPQEIDDNYLKNYMNSKLYQDVYRLKADKIIHYKSNLFLFKNHTCITILNIPEKAINTIDDMIYITKLSTFVNHIREKYNVKNWLRENGKYLDKTKELKRCIISVPKNLSYEYLMNNFPLNAIKYIKNDFEFKNAINKINKKRSKKIKERYYFTYAMLLLIPKNQILKLQSLLKNNSNSVFHVNISKKITKKQLDLCYKQLFIILGGDLQPKYDKFNVNDNLCYDIINDHFTNIIPDYIRTIKEIFKDTKG